MADLRANTTRKLEPARRTESALSRHRDNADTALNGMVLLGEGGRVQIAVLCSALGLGIG
jgi:hypothetical protein